MKQFATLSNPELTLTHFLGTALISFEYAEIRDYFVKEHAHNLKLIYDDQTCLKISEAAKPNDINWFNLASEPREATKTRLQAIGLAILFTVLFLGVVVLIQVWRVKSGLTVVKFSTNNKKLMQKTTEGFWFFAGACTIVKILQVIMGSVLTSFLSKSKSRTKSGELTTNILLKTPTYFIFLTLSISIFMEYWSSATKSWNNVAVILNMFVIQCLMMRTMPNLIHPELIGRAIKLKCFYSNETSPIYQVKLN